MRQTATQASRPRPAGPEAPGDESDRLLLNRIVAGDREALRELYESHYSALLRFLRRVAREPGLAEEALNDVMLVVWHNGRSFGGRSTVSTWLMGIAYRKALKLLAASRRRSSRLAPIDVEDWLEHSAVVADAHEQGELRDLLERTLSRLSPEHRAVVELTYFGGHSYQDIATITGCPVNTVKTRMFYARAQLRRLLPPEAVQ